ncbi:hypothetical protein E7T06_08580 [Deinococcus sp. Arct2-2]|uniref:ArsR/SmtB family transcription factor n=1 Tax=Deinococcus sp. Arct2-2 TaxID=2568653 RepID=UPI0010A4972F|nr:hypothetical protein [Deinococcus sp. Arct2-2]THF70230.1 hypothetical protein E7T06_08580 [Deinococcus sp. Arct2-2]
MPLTAPQRIDDPQVVRQLLDPPTLTCLEPLLGQALSVSEVARQVGAGVRAVHYRLQILLACGLVQVVHEERRAGRSIKVYQAVADAFFVPFSATGREDVEALWLSLTLPLYEQLVRTLANTARTQGHDPEVWGVHVRLDQAGNLDLNLGPEQPLRAAPTPYTPATLLEWEELHLSTEQARRLKTELQALLHKYAAERGPHSYLLALGLAPLTPASAD